MYSNTQGVTLLSFYTVICEARFHHFSKATTHSISLWYLCHSTLVYGIYAIVRMHTIVQNKRHHLGQSPPEKIYERSTRSHLQSWTSLQFFTRWCNTKTALKNYLPSQSTVKSSIYSFLISFRNYPSSFLEKWSVKVNTHVKYQIQMTISDNLWISL